MKAARTRPIMLEVEFDFEGGDLFVCLFGLRLGVELFSTSIFVDAEAGMEFSGKGNLQTDDGL